MPHPVQNIIHRDYDTLTAYEETPLETTETEVDMLISQIQNNKALGHDKLKGSIVKKLQPYLSPLLTKIFNTCLQLNYFPKIWKIGELRVTDTSVD
jgi:hypothetical protein